MISSSEYRQQYSTGLSAPNSIRHTLQNAGQASLAATRYNTWLEMRADLHKSYLPLFILCFFYKGRKENIIILTGFKIFRMGAAFRRLLQNYEKRLLAELRLACSLTQLCQYKYIY